MTNRPFVAMLGAMALLAPSPVHAQTLQATENWRLGCDNLRHCTILALAVDDPIPGAYVWISRPGGPRAPVEIELVMSFGDAAAGPFERIEIVGPGFEDALQGEPLWRRAEHYQRAALAERDVQTLLAALTRGGTAGIRGVFEDGRTTETIAISLDEGRPLLESFDRVQHREGTEDAIILTGETPADAVPPPPDLPRIDTVPAPAMAPPPALQDADLAEVCDEDVYEEDIAVDQSGWLTSDLAWWSVRCYMGASHAGNTLVVGPGSGPVRPAPFTVPEALAGLIHTGSLPNMDISTDSMSLHFAHTGRGAGDCGHAGSFTWDGESFRLDFYTMLDACRAVGVDDWLVLWRSQGDPLDR